MINVTPPAAAQIRVAATQADCDEMGLRITARRDAAGSLHYAMGFDDTRSDDLVVASEGIALVVSPRDTGLLDGMTLDYVEFLPGDFRFIFINPNDAAPAPPVEPSPESVGCGNGGRGCRGDTA
jgi:iron-sulfur cluster assembly protein